MPSRKTFFTLIVCVGLVISSYLLVRIKSPVLPGNNSVFTISKFNNNSNDEWKSLLNTVDPTNKGIIEDLTKNNYVEPEDNTLTSQISVDFMSEYLRLKSGGRQITDADVYNIVGKTLSSSDYSKIYGKVYTLKDLKITTKNDKTTVNKYKYNIQLIFKVRDSQIAGNPLFLTTSIGGAGESQALANIESTMMAGRGLIEDFLKIEVPANVAQLHLNLMNSVSQLLSDIEALKEVSNDPVKSMVALNQYSSDLLFFSDSLDKMRIYISQN